MKKIKSEIYIDNFQFAEGLRWHNGALWFCDLHDKRIYQVDSNRALHCFIELNDQPAAVGWLSDGSMLVTSLYDRKLLGIEHNQVKTIADLSSLAPGYGHDMIVAADDTVYISASGFYPAYGIEPIKSNIMMLTPDGRLQIAVSNVGYPNGLALIDNQSRLLVAETFAADIAQYDVNSDHTLSNRQPFYVFDDIGFQVTFDKLGIPEDLSRYYPDGIDYDGLRDILWVASPGRNEVVGIHDNDIQLVVHTNGIPFDCAVGGTNYDVLFIGSANPGLTGWSGQIEYVQLQPTYVGGYE